MRYIVAIKKVNDVLTKVRVLPAPGESLTTLDLELEVVIQHLKLNEHQYFTFNQKHFLARVYPFWDGREWVLSREKDSYAPDVLDELPEIE